MIFKTHDLVKLVIQWGDGEKQLKSDFYDFMEDYNALPERGAGMSSKIRYEHYFTKENADKLVRFLNDSRGKY